MESEKWRKAAVPGGGRFLLGVLAVVDEYSSSLAPVILDQ